MDYLIIEDNTITNIIVCDSDEVAAEFGAVSWYEGAAIGGAYEPPEPEPVLTLEERVDNVEKSRADQTAVDELNEALHMILSGVTE